MKEQMTRTTLICDRCNKRYYRNKAYPCWGPDSSKKAQKVTGFSLIGMRSYPVNHRDLCDDCIKDLIDWYNGNEKELTNRYINGEEK